ncbi:corA-like Mg2+ transporter domain-containing protein, putative [Eimeria praecox]|uniref:CorA-like Mg2+ transporter domain-containing protein, putative n=1 Tax=Eimeria praecox TaxID=51316 RepID=U6H5B5_9EIME|nr:corA-like Mg2+ transporter domain-containing protein, putative [Eimeria praecox]
MEDLHALKEPISLYQDRVDAFDKAFDELISNNTYLQRMELSKYAKHPNLYDEPTDKEAVNPDLEILLEYFDQEIDQARLKVQDSRSSLKRFNRRQREALDFTFGGYAKFLNKNGNEEGSSSHSMFILVSSVIAFTAVLSLLAVLYLVKTIRL